MSHTLQVRVEYRDKQALASAVEKVGGTVIGDGCHYLFAGEETGWGFRLLSWNYPLILTEDGILKFDDYGGRWGQRSDIERLKAEYAAAVVERKCAELCWMTERRGDEILIYHPDGMIVVKTDATVDATGFVGRGCEAAVEAIASALGQETARYCKPEANLVRNEAKQIGG